MTSKSSIHQHCLHRHKQLTNFWVFFRLAQYVRTVPRSPGPQELTKSAATIAGTPTSGVNGFTISLTPTDKIQQDGIPMHWIQSKDSSIGSLLGLRSSLKERIQDLFSSMIFYYLRFVNKLFQFCGSYSVDLLNQYFHQPDSFSYAAAVDPENTTIAT